MDTAGVVAPAAADAAAAADADDDDVDVDDSDRLNTIQNMFTYSRHRLFAQLVYGQFLINALDFAICKRYSARIAH